MTSHYRYVKAKFISPENLCGRTAVGDPNPVKINGPQGICASLTCDKPGIDRRNCAKDRVRHAKPPENWICGCQRRDPEAGHLPDVVKSIF
jgi:hypothetical protein